ncbi:hypothetical protein EAE96_002814 [Botrytis aclada]|nr:hypothetical protein EAE96_002814 [Botrytis aclada]
MDGNSNFANSDASLEIAPEFYSIESVDSLRNLAKCAEKAVRNMLPHLSNVDANNNITMACGRFISSRNAELACRAERKTQPPGNVVSTALKRTFLLPIFMDS